MTIHALKHPFYLTYDGHPLRLVQNIQRVWSVCHIDDATPFETHDDAMVAIVDYGLRGNGRVTIKRREQP